jgi:hypothetical protein
MTNIRGGFFDTLAPLISVSAPPFFILELVASFAK